MYEDTIDKMIRLYDKKYNIYQYVLYDDPAEIYVNSI